MKFYSGLPETRCGRGSTLAATEEIRAELPALLNELGVKFLVDAPCGDFNWLSSVDLSGICYTGCDDDMENLEIAWRRPNNCRSSEFILMDIVQCAPPPADMVLCREFLQHIPNEDVATFISSLDCKWLLATNYENEVNGDIFRSADFREINLTKPPFSLPRPVRVLRDAEKTLALWSLI